MEESCSQSAEEQSAERSESHERESEQQDLENSASKEDLKRKRLKEKLQKLKDAYNKKGMYSVHTSQLLSGRQLSSALVTCYMQC